MSAGSEDTLVAIRRRQHAIVDEVLRRNSGRWEALDAAGLAAVENALHAVADRFMAVPAAAIAGFRDERRQADAIELLTDLFGARQDGDRHLARVGA